MLLAVGGAVVLAIRATPAFDTRAQLPAAAGALALWGVVAGVVAPALGEEEISATLTAPDGVVYHQGHGALVVAGLVAAALALAWAWWRSARVFGPRSADPVDDQGPAGGPPDPGDGGEGPRTLPPRRARDPVGVQHHAPDPETA